jgi:Uma2 family endonuclease
MASAIQSRIGPSDAGRLLSLHEFLAADYQEGYHYELIDGRLYVSPVPNPAENVIEIWALAKLTRYAKRRPQTINYVTNKARVFVPDRPRVTAPEPDLAAYKDFPLELPLQKIRWQDVSPLLVGEVLGDDPEKDLIRNVELYLEVPSIKEYWLFDCRQEAERPTLRVHRRRGGRWHIQDLNFGDVYTTPLLPRFRLLVDPRK